ncbi:hypothetical protein [Gynurincola endophyticus]|uniref:hypothetical protein n=1 Tax=Gynurincola endophyticus TaxID=2479004 RepID=UPI000F8D6603|nr:hypothetical protein [Gynurincola endophyticus]
MKSKIILSLLLVGTLGISSLSAQVVNDRKAPEKKIERKIDRKDDRKKEFTKGDKRKMDHRRDGKFKRGDRKKGQMVVLHKDCKDCQKLNKKIAKHKHKSHPSRTHRAR